MDLQENTPLIEIDSNSGFCFGVVNAIKSAEKALEEHGSIYCLGDIVHNGAEVERLENIGLKTITREEYFKLSNAKVLLRAHGEPPETYEYARNNNIEIIDATCPVVIGLQKKVKKGYEKESKQNGQVVVYGKHGHPEIIGLLGQTEQNAIVISSEAEFDKVDFSRPISFYTQTTKSLYDFQDLAAKLESKAETFKAHDTICRQVSNREEDIRIFAKKYDMIVFVSGKKSSNGMVLCSYCKEENENTHFISKPNELSSLTFNKTQTIGICGATSTPKWLMEEVANKIKDIISQL